MRTQYISLFLLALIFTAQAAHLSSQKQYTKDKVHKPSKKLKQKHLNNIQVSVQEDGQQQSDPVEIQDGNTLQVTQQSEFEQLAYSHDNFQDYYNALLELLNNKQTEFNGQYDAKNQECTDYSSQIAEIPPQIEKGQDYIIFLQDKIDKNQERIDKIFYDRCKAHETFIDHLKNNKITLRLIAFLKQALENFNMIQLRKVGAIMTQFMDPKLMSNKDAVSTMLAQLKEVDNITVQQFDTTADSLENQEQQRTQEEIGEGHVDNGREQIDVDEFDSSERRLLSHYKEEINGILDQLAQNIHDENERRQNEEIVLNDQTIQYTQTLEIENSHLYEEIENQTLVINGLRQDLAALETLHEVCTGELEYLGSIKQAQQEIIDHVQNNQPTIEEQFNNWKAAQLSAATIVRSVRQEDEHTPPGDGHDSGFQFDQAVNEIEVSLSWESTADLDCSIILTDANHQIVDVVNYSTKTSDDGSIVHQGDTTDGSSGGYDEVIKIALNNVPANIVHLYSVISVYSSDKFFSDVPNLKSDIISQGQIQHHYEIHPQVLENADSTTSFVLSKIYRDQTGQWSIIAADIELHAPETIRHTKPENHPLIQPVIECFETRQCPLPEYAHVEHEAGADGNQVNHEQPVELDSSLTQIDVALAWEAQTDLDFSIIITDVNNQIIDSVYYSKTTSDDGAVTHHGDNTSGDANGYDETITIQLDQVDPATHNFYIALSVFSSSYFFSDVPELKSDIIGNGIVQHEYKIHPPNLPNAGDTASLLLAKIYRNPNDNNKWLIKAVDVELLSTSDIRVMKPDNFARLQPVVDCFENRCNLPDYARIEHEISQSQVQGRISQGDVYTIDPSLTEIDVSLSWEADTDLDCSIFITDSNNQVIDSVYWGKTSSDDEAIVHQGDNRNGEGDGYDEVVKIYLQDVDPATQNLYIVLSIYSDGMFFDSVPNLNSDIVAGGEVKTGYSIQPANLNNAADTTSLIMAKIYRDPNNAGQWLLTSVDIELMQNGDSTIRQLSSGSWNPVQSVVEAFEAGSLLPDWAHIENYI